MKLPYPKPDHLFDKENVKMLTQVSKGQTEFTVT